MGLCHLGGAQVGGSGYYQIQRMFLADFRETMPDNSFIASDC
jgi:hypothetical protein